MMQKKISSKYEFPVALHKYIKQFSIQNVKETEPNVFLENCRKNVSN